MKKKLVAMICAIGIGLAVGTYMQNKHDEELARKKNFQKFKVITIPWTKRDAEWLENKSSSVKYIDDPYTEEVEVYKIVDYIIGYNEIQIVVDK